MIRFLLNQIVILCLIAFVVMAILGRRDTVPIQPGAAKAVRVLIVADPTKSYGLPADQALNSARSGDIDAWCRLNCQQIDGTPEKRVWEPDEDVSKESKFWQDAMKHDHGTLPEVETYVNRHWNKPRTFKDSAELMNILGGAKSEF